MLPLGESEKGTTTAGQALRKAIQEMGLGKSDAVVIASREIVEIRTLSVPSVDADELPDIIRFQAQRQMANMGENWPIDFILLPSAGLENKVALAGAISPAHLAEIESALVGAGLQLSRVVLRPLEIARFALSADSTGTMKEGAAVVVCLTDNQADLLLLNAGAVVQLRSTRLPTDSHQIANTIVGEIKRSLVAAASQLNGVTLSSALLIAPAELAGKVEAAVAAAVGCNVAVVDPLVMLPSAYEGGESLTHEAANRLAAIAGVLGSPQPDRRTQIDFKSPKKRAPREVNVSRYILVCAAAGLLLLAVGSWWYSTIGSMNQELADLRKELNDKKNQGEVAVKQIAEFNEVKRVLDGSPNWLDELELISLNMPSSEKVLMYNPTFSVGTNGEGTIKSKVYGISSEVISEFADMLRGDERFRVNSAGVSKSNAWEQYPWETTISITFNRGWKLLDRAKTSPAKKPDVKSDTKPAEVKEEVAKPAESEAKAADEIEEKKLGEEVKSESKPSDESDATPEAKSDETPAPTLPAPTPPATPATEKVVGS
jgi:Tfp pilus assembly PilM family ATPase/cell division protein FtsL